MTQRESGSNKLHQLLTTLNQEGKFSITVLTDSQGLPIASAAQPGYDPERQSAVVALVQRMAEQASSRMGLDMDEICLNAADGQRLVCRVIEVGNNRLILAVLMSSREQSHRRRE
ncbi:MAG TPA: hypothetical protein VHO48_14730, partial [Anaerolineaceae bacterium]|nr:hypothetical protein [Anaerolineaceae bacterium]